MMDTTLDLVLEQTNLYIKQRLVEIEAERQQLQEYTTLFIQACQGDPEAAETLKREYEARKAH